MPPPATASTAPRAHLSDRVAQALTQEIRTGRLSPGDRLPTETALCVQFDVSRTVIREAVSQLKSLGLLDSRQGSGVYVRAAGFVPLHFDAANAQSRQAVVQMVEVRRALEAEVAALAARRRRGADLKRIQQAVLALDAAVAGGGDGVEEDMRFHRAIADAAGNPFLIDTLQYLGQFLRGATRVTRANEARREDFARQVRDEHAAIVLAIEAADPLRAQQAAARHMDNAIARIEQADPAFWKEQGVTLATPLLARVVSGAAESIAQPSRRSR
jgi:GntR family transcriptional regulator, transcriptional repressor for pyruvate dehydrogenase complex